MKKNKYTGHLVDRNYNDIDKDLIGVKTLKVRDILEPNDNVAPAQGSPFLSRLKSLTDMLKKSDIVYRD